MEEQVTIGELGRRMDRVEDTLTRGFDKLTARLDRDYVQIAVYAADRNADNARLAALEAESAGAKQRIWQIRLAMYASLLSVPVGVITAWLVTRLS